MPEKDALTPRVFIIRHGETEWAKKGKYTGITDIELTEEGIRQVSSGTKQMLGPGKLIDPSRIVFVLVSPRKRAKQTYSILLPGESVKVRYTELVAEWNYGDYEGHTTEEIRRLRREKGLDQERDWNVWRDGCEGGESPEQVTERIDQLIREIKAVQGPYMTGEKPVDILIVGHGLYLRCLVKRWLGLEIDSSLRLKLDPGAVTVLSYDNQDIEQPAVHIGIAVPPTQA